MNTDSLYATHTDTSLAITQSYTNSPSRRYMALNTKPASIQAQMLVDRLTERVGRVMGVKATSKLKGAVGAILGDLRAIINEWPDAHCFRSVGIGTFKGQPVGYRPFTLALEGLLRLRMIDRTLGVYRSNGTGEASTFRPSALLLNEVQGCGVDAGDWNQHFSYLPRSGFVANPIIRKAARRPWTMEGKARSLPIDWTDPRPRAAREQVERLNTFFAGVTIEGANHHGFQRIFGNGDDPNFAWDMGARLYSMGDSYQHLSEARRASIRLDGEEVVELDISSSHLTIINSLLGCTDDGPDGYDVEGIPRFVTKTWVTMCLGYGKFHKNWSPAAIKRCKRKFECDLEAEYPLVSTRERLKAALPVIGQALSRGLGWAKLQYIESCAIIDAVAVLAFEHGIPALPVHDSLIIGASNLNAAKAVLETTFFKHVGINPRLKVR